MPDFSKLETSIPVAPLNLIVMDSAKELGDSVDRYISEFRRSPCATATACATACLPG